MFKEEEKVIIDRSNLKVIKKGCEVELKKCMIC